MNDYSILKQKGTTEHLIITPEGDKLTLEEAIVLLLNEGKKIKESL